MKAAVITFPGSNCDDDCIYVLEKAGFKADLLFHKDATNLMAYDLVVFPGGFSYGDYLRCGAIAALSPIMESVRAFAAEGRYLIGICNGFQILCELGLLPGALAKNESLKYVCRDVTLQVMQSDTPWTQGLKTGDRLVMPIGHGDGRYVVSNEDYQNLVEKNQILLTYCDEKGEPTKGANPNGSVHNIAGVCNEKKNVFGLMPHPDRCTDLRSGDGLKVWQSVLKTLSERNA